MPGKNANQVRTSRGLDLGLFSQWTDYLKAAERKADPIFGPWLAFAALKDSEFVAQAPELTVKYAADKSLNELVTPLFSKPFTPWERLSQALLMSNELIYVN